MKTLVGVVTLLLLVTACRDMAPTWQEEAASAIGEELAGRLAEPLAHAAATGEGADTTAVLHTLDTALEDMALPSGVLRVVPGPGSGTRVGEGDAAVATTLVVVPDGETQSMFCMVFAMSANGSTVAEPAQDDPVKRCSGIDYNRFLNQ